MRNVHNAWKPNNFLIILIYIKNGGNYTMKKKTLKELFTEPTTTGITYITREHTKWDKAGNQMHDYGFPIQIDIELNTFCNLKCIMCHQRTPSKPELKAMRLPLAYQIIGEASAEGAESVKLQYRGEPLLYPRFRDVVRLAKVGNLFIHFNTNGTLLSNAMAKFLVEQQVDKVIFSVDSAFPETYEKIRIGANFFEVEENIKNLYNWKKAKRSKLPLIGVHAVVQDLNREEMRDGIFEKYWKKYADEIAYMEEFDMVDGSMDKTPLPKWHCAQLWQRLVVLADGRVVPCCGGVDYENKKVFSLGNVQVDTLKDVWEGGMHTYLQDMHREGLSHEIEMCAKCRIRKNIVKKLKEGY